MTADPTSTPTADPTLNPTLTPTLIRAVTSGLELRDANNNLVTTGKGFGNVYFNGRPVCTHGWSSTDARVVCKTLGMIYSTYRTSSYYGRPTTSVFAMDDIACNGNEQHIKDCPHKDDRTENCHSGEVAGVVCYKKSGSYGVLELRDNRNGDMKITTNLGFGNVYLDGKPQCAYSFGSYNAYTVCNFHVSISVVAKLKDAVGSGLFVANDAGNFARVAVFGSVVLVRAVLDVLFVSVADDVVHCENRSRWSAIVGARAVSAVNHAKRFADDSSGGRTPPMCAHRPSIKVHVSEAFAGRNQIVVVVPKLQPRRNRSNERWRQGRPHGWVRGRGRRGIGGRGIGGRGRGGGLRRGEWNGRRSRGN